MSAMSEAAGKLRAFVERIERVESDIAELNADKSDIYKEIRGDGFDVKTVRKIVAKRKLETHEREEQDAIFDLYWSALYGGTETGTIDATRACTTPSTKYPSQRPPAVKPEPLPCPSLASSGDPIQQSLPDLGATTALTTRAGDESVVPHSPSPQAVTGQHLSSSQMNAELAKPVDAQGAPGSFINERCKSPKDCQFAHDKYHVTCPPCGSAWAAQKLSERRAA